MSTSTGDLIELGRVMQAEATGKQSIVSIGRTEVEQSFASIHRRNMFAVRSRLFCDGLASSRPISSIILSLSNFGWVLVRKLDRLAVAVFDLVESVRTLRRVEYFGQPHIAAVTSDYRIPQHPRYRRYWSDRENSIEIGMLLGGDFVRYQGRYYPVELGLDPTMNAERRALYADLSMDPIVNALLNDAADRGFDHLFLFHCRWGVCMRSDFVSAASSKKIRLTIGSNSFRDSATTHAVSGIPGDLPDRTLCVALHGQRSPLDYYVSDKRATSEWLQQEAHDGKVLGVVESRTKPFVPPVDGSWPNLVVKSGGANFGHSVRFIKVRNTAEAALGAREAERELRGSWIQRAKASLLKTNDVVYQQFIPPELTAAGHARIIRAHFLFTPDRDLFLSSHYVVSAHKPPAIRPGKVYARGLVVNKNVGGRYERTDPETESELEHLASELGVTLRSAVEKKFVTAPQRASLASV